MIEVGKRYGTIPKHATIEKEYFTIFMKCGEYFYGINDSGEHLVNFDKKGKDLWIECGGHWTVLDTSVELEPLWKLEKLK
jgi:hypothetical protein